MEIIITDLTRFSEGKDTVCMAGIERSTGKCIRPMPYLTKSQVKDNKVLPGSILEFDFSIIDDLHLPHIEDVKYSSKIINNGYCTSDEFKTILDNSLSNSVASGFNTPITNRQTHIDINESPAASIITIKVTSNNISIVKDGYEKDTVKIIFTDNDGNEFFYRAISDLGFYNYAKDKGIDADTVRELNNHIRSQDDIYLRVGLSREHDQGDGRIGYWFQVNGIYTFPDYIEEIRSYR